MLGNFLSCIKGVKDPIETKEEGGISLETPQWKIPHLVLRRESPGFSRVAAENLGFL